MNFSYLRPRHWFQIAAAAAIFGFLFWFASKGTEAHRKVAWIEALCGVGVLMMSVFIWFNNLRKEWEEKLPKRLTVHFHYRDTDVMLAKQMPLTDEADARAWSQQIGRKMNKDKDISIKPMYKFVPVGINPRGTFFEYRVIYYLNEVPENLKSMLGYDQERHEHRACLVWELLEDPDGSYSVQEGVMPAVRKLK
jgi:hypothetical protein